MVFTKNNFTHIFDIGTEHNYVTLIHIWHGKYLITPEAGASQTLQDERSRLNDEMGFREGLIWHAIGTQPRLLPFYGPLSTQCTILAFLTLSVQRFFKIWNILA